MSVDHPTTPEVFRPIPGLTGYEIGDRGTVVSRWKSSFQGPVLCDRRRPLKPFRNESGYLWIELGKGRKFGVHRLVLEAFVGPCPPGMECRHLDGDPANNVLDNLTWGTHSENIQDRRDHGTLSDIGYVTKAKLTPEKVRTIRLRCESGVPRREIATEMGISLTYVRRILRRDAWPDVD